MRISPRLILTPTGGKWLDLCASEKNGPSINDERVRQGRRLASEVSGSARTSLSRECC
jgi:hypothetical protein